METIYKILEEIRPEFDFKESKDFIEDGYLDSFDIVAVVSELETAFGILIDGLDVIPENFVNVEAICNVVKKMAESPNEMEEKIMTEQEKMEELVDVFEMDLDEFNKDTLLEDMETWDSVAVLSFIALMDEKSGKQFHASEITACKKVSDLHFGERDKAEGKRLLPAPIL